MSLCQLLLIKMSNFLHFPSIIAHIYPEKAVSLHIEIKKQPLLT